MDNEVSISTIGNAAMNKNFTISAAKVLKKANVSTNRFITEFPSPSVGIEFRYVLINKTVYVKYFIGSKWRRNKPIAL